MKKLIVKARPEKKNTRNDADGKSPRDFKGMNKTSAFKKIRPKILTIHVTF